MNGIRRAGVIGAGVFGGHHARHWSTLSGATLVGVFDPDPERSQALAAKYGADAFDDYDALLSVVDVVSITSPAVTHGEQALKALRAGKSVYVEKPLAASLEDADAIALEAARRSLVAATGFSERAAFRALGLDDAPERPTLIEAARLSPPGTRNLDVSVVLDLMIHDLDLCAFLGAGEPVTVEAEGVFGGDGLLDEARAEITFETGTAARLEASRLAKGVSRIVSLTYPSGVVEVDLGSGEVTSSVAFAVNTRFAETPEAARSAPDEPRGLPRGREWKRRSLGGRRPTAPGPWIWLWPWSAPRGGEPQLRSARSSRYRP